MSESWMLLWKVKGWTAPEEWRHFCSEVVPLFCTEKFCWTNDEALTGEVEIANYSESDLNGKQLSWVLTDSKQQVLDKGCFYLYRSNKESWQR